MKKSEIKLGDVTYQLSRVFAGSKTAAELLVDAVADRVREETAFDVSKKSAV